MVEIVREEKEGEREREILNDEKKKEINIVENRYGGTERNRKKKSTEK